MWWLQNNETSTCSCQSPTAAADWVSTPKLPPSPSSGPGPSRRSSQSLWTRSPGNNNKKINIKRSPGKVFLNFGKRASITWVNFTHLHHHQQKYDHHHHHHHYHQQYHPHQHHRPHHNIHHDYLRRRVAMDGTVNFHLNRSILRWTPLLVHCHFRGGCKDWNFIIMIRNIMHNDDNNDYHEIVSHHHGDNHD